MACGYSGRSLAFPEHLCIHPMDMLCVLDTPLQYCLSLDSRAGLSEGRLRKPCIDSGKSWTHPSSFSLTPSLGTTSHFPSSPQRINSMQGFPPGPSIVFYSLASAPAEAEKHFEGRDNWCNSTFCKYYSGTVRKTLRPTDA